jgi:hypothetical protein
MADRHDPHADLHSERGALPGEHPGRAGNPIIVADPVRGDHTGSGLPLRVPQANLIPGP